MRNSIFIAVFAAMCLLTACDNSEKSDSTPDSQAVTATESISESKETQITTTSKSGTINQGNSVQTTTQNTKNQQSTPIAVTEKPEETSVYTQ